MGQTEVRRGGTPACNRVTPLGDIVAIPLRGAWTGNRGILHRGTDVVRFHAHNAWITCALRFRGRRAAQWQPHHFTWLYFHDEAVALAAGHRPCAYCRRSDYTTYRTAVATATGDGLLSAKALDAALHAERLYRGTHQRRWHRRSWRSLPRGAFVLVEDIPMLVGEDSLTPWQPTGYAATDRHHRPARGDATVVTPPTSLTALTGGYRPQVDPSAYGE